MILKFKIGDPVRVMPFTELEWLHQYGKKKTETQPIKYFSFSMLPYFGSLGCVTDRQKDVDGNEFYRISVDSGVNAWDAQLLRVE